MNPHQNTPTNQPKRPARGGASHTNFIEALKSAGTGITKDTATGIGKDLIGGTVNQIVDSVFNTNQGTTSPQTQENTPQQPFNFAEYLKSNEQATRSRERVKYQYEQSETIVFNRRQQELDQKIESIRIEIKRLATEIVNLDRSTQAAIEREITNPGTYHLNFFEKLLTFLRDMKKRVTESRHWAALHSQRSQTKSYYWKMAGKKKSGTMFSMSQERAVATQTG